MLKDSVDAVSDDMNQIDPLNTALTQYGHLIGRPGPIAPHRAMEMRLLSFGYLYDNGTWLAQSEFAQARGGWQVIKDTDSWYLLGAYRVGKFTPYLSYSEVRNKEPAYPAPAVASNPLFQPLADIVNLIDPSIKATWEQKTVSAGVRYDIYKNIALKAQYDRIHKPGSLAAPNQGMFLLPGTFSTTSTGHAPAAIKNINVNLLTVTVDFVF